MRHFSSHNTNDTVTKPTPKSAKKSKSFRIDNAKCLLDSEKRQAELESKFWTGPDWEDHDGFRNASGRVLLT
jgi:hypothetical protein